MSASESDDDQVQSFLFLFEQRAIVRLPCHQNWCLDFSVSAKQRLLRARSESPFRWIPLDMPLDIFPWKSHFSMEVAAYRVPRLCLGCA